MQQFHWHFVFCEVLFKMHYIVRKERVREKLNIPSFFFIMKQHIPFTFEYERICISLAEIRYQYRVRCGLFDFRGEKGTNRRKWLLNFWVAFMPRNMYVIYCMGFNDGLVRYSKHLFTQVNESPLRMASHIIECDDFSLLYAIRMKTQLFYLRFLLQCSQLQYSLCEQKINRKHFNCYETSMAVLSSLLFFSLSISCFSNRLTYSRAR